MTQNGLIYLKAVDIKPRTQQIHYVYNIYAILYSFYNKRSGWSTVKHRTREEILQYSQTCKQSNRSNRKVIDWSQLRCNSNSNRLKFFKCNSNSNRLKFYLLHLLLSIIFLLQFTLCYFSEGGCRKMIT